jgi:Fe-S-cluster-containing dehydrogenase component
VTAIGVACTTGRVETASAKTGTYATLIDLTKCDGCKNEPIPKCVEACRKEKEERDQKLSVLGLD